MRKVRLVQVGLGPWGLDWARDVLPTVAEIEVVAAVDPDPAAVTRLRKALGPTSPPTFETLRAALQAVDCDAVLAVLPTVLHAAVTREALLAGKHVIVEKPFTSTLEEAAELVVLAEQRGLFLMVSQNYRHYPASIAAAELVSSGELGRPTSVTLDFRRHAPTGGYRYWTIPGPLLADMSIHHFDLMRMVLGEDPVEVSCRTWNPPGSPFRHDPAGVVTLAFPSGVTVSYRGSWMIRGRDTPWGGEWHMEFERGAAEWTCRGDAQHRLAKDRLAVAGEDGVFEARALPEIRYFDRAGTTAALAAAITTGEAPPRFSSGRDNIASLALVDASARSAAAGGAPVRLADVLPTLTDARLT